MIFINFDAEPAALRADRERSGRAARALWARPRARVAHRQNYPIASNWKLAVENYCECYHCAPAHPEYSVGARPRHSAARSARSCSRR